MKDVIIIALLIAILLATSNPAVETHQQAIAGAVRSAVTGAVTEPQDHNETLMSNPSTTGNGYPVQSPVYQRSNSLGKQLCALQVIGGL